MNRFLFFAILMAGLRPGQIRADGFLAPPAPSPGRAAELETIRAEAEGLGLPALPPEAEYARVGDFLAETTRYWNEFSDGPFGNGWRVPPATPGADEVFVSVAGHRLSAPPAARPAWEPVRLERDRVLLSRAPDEKLAAEFGRAGAAGLLLFAVQLAQTGRPDAGAELLARLDGAGLLADARAALPKALADAALREAHDVMLATGDFAAVADVLARSLAANPPAPGAADARSGFLGSARARLAGPAPDVPGLDAEEQELVRALDDWVWSGRPTDHAFRANGAVWLVPSAWTNAVDLPDDDLRRLLVRGPRAFRILDVLREDDRPVRAVGLLPVPDGEVPAPFLRRRDLANAVADLMLASVRRYGPSLPRGLDADSTEEDVLRHCVRYGSRPEMLHAHLARLAGEGSLPWLEDEILDSVRTNFWGTGAAEWISPLAGRDAPPLAERYLAVRGKAAAGFRDRLCEALREAWPREFGPGSRYVYRPGQIGPDLSEVFRDVERRLADFPLGPGDPASVRARAAALSDWLLARARRADRNLFPDAPPAPPEPPIPLPLFPLAPFHP